MAPMITDSYLKYSNSEFGSNNHHRHQLQASYNRSQQPASMPYSSTEQLGSTFRFQEESIIDALRGNNYKLQSDVFEELIIQVQTNNEALVNFRNLPDFLNSLGQLLINTISNEVQRNCLKFLQVYFKSIDIVRVKRKLDPKLNEKFKLIDSLINDILLEYLIIASVSSKLQLKQISIDLIYTYMKITDSISNCFSKFIKYGIENTDTNISKPFMNPTLCILLTEEFSNQDFFYLVKSLTKQLANSKLESCAIKCLNKIEKIVSQDTFNDYLNRLPQSLKNAYLQSTNKTMQQQHVDDYPLKSNNTFSQISDFDMNNNDDYTKTMKFNIIPMKILQKLSGEDEIQRLQAINQLDTTITDLNDVKVIYPYYQDFIVYMNNFVDDPNYEIRLASLKILCKFIQKLGTNVNQCYKQICTCARHVMSQTHQSKNIKQSLNTMLLLTIENMNTPSLVLECLLEKIKDRSAKAREEFLNIITASVLKFPIDKFDSLRKIFVQVAPLLCDIKRNVRHAALECSIVLYTRIMQTDRNFGNFLDQLDNVPDFQNSETAQLVKDVILFRLNRNKLATLNSDMTIEYGLKIPPPGVTFPNGYDLDVEWVISASASSASASNLSSARSQKSTVVEPAKNNNGTHRMINLNDKNNISTGSFRRPSGTKRLPWDEINDSSSMLINPNIPKVMRSREVAPLKAFPLNDDIDFANGNMVISNNGFNTSLNNGNNNNNNNNGTNSDNNPNGNYKNGVYPASTSYQEKYLKKLQGEQQTILSVAKTNSQLDLTDITNTVKKNQNDKAYSLDNLYNIDDNINSENNIQKRKYANLNLKNSIIPSKPTIPRRNSANKYGETTFINNISSSNLDDDLSIQNSTDDFKSVNNLDLDDSRSKYDTVPNIRNSAKNRKKLEKIFSLGSNGPTSPGSSSNITGDLNDFNSRNTFNTNTKKVVNNREENNLYLSKLKAEKNNNDILSSRYSPSNPESGVFSMSDYDHSENRFIRQQINYNNSEGQQKKNQHFNSSNTIKQVHNIENLDVVSPFNRKPVLLKSPSKTKIDNSTPNNNNNQSSNRTPQSTSTNNIDYNTITGVSYKQNHGSDVEIVGVKLGNNSNNQDLNMNSNNNNNISLNAKKRNSLKSLNEGPLMDMENNYNNYNNNELDIVGKGYNSNYDSDNTEKLIRQQILDNSDYIPTNPDEYPLSMSFRSRLKQKTQEKIEEKQKRKVEKTKAKQLKDYDSMSNSPVPPEGDRKNFGLSISGYPNQPNPYDEYNERKILVTKTNLGEAYAAPPIEPYNNDVYNQYDEYPNNRNSPTLPVLEKPKFKPTAATQNRLKAKAAAAAASTTEGSNNSPNLNDNYSEPAYKNSLINNNNNSNMNREKDSTLEYDNSNVYGIVKEDFPKQPFKNPDNALRDAMNFLAQEDWEKKCQAMNIIRRLSLYHEDLTVNNIHSIVIALNQEVKNLRSQVARFALLTFGDLFTNLKRNMDVDLDIAVKSILNKNVETSDFIRTDVEKCLEKMANNVTTHKGLIAIINGGASHRNPLVRRTAAQFTYKCCEVMGPGKILSGIKDVTEKVLVTASQFVVDGPVDIRWYGRKIFHMLMTHDEFDRLLVKCLSDSTRKNIKEILDTIRVKGPGEVPTESARNSRKGARNAIDAISRSAGSNAASNSGTVINNGRAGLNMDLPNPSSSSIRSQPPVYQAPSLNRMESQEYAKSLCAQLRHTDFRERIDAIEKFQVMCETETDIAIHNLVPIFDKFNACLTESNSKVNYKALSTLFQIIPIIGDNLNTVISNVIPLVAQNLASKNSEIQDMASSILDVCVDYLDGGMLIQPFTNIAQHGNVRIKPQVIYKLADLIPKVYGRKQKQIELHVLPTVWILLNSVKGNSLANGSNALNSSVTRLCQNLYEQMGELLIDRASNSSNVSSRNLELLKELIMSPIV